MTNTSISSSTEWIRPEDARLSDLLEVLTAETELDDFPYASRVEQQVLVYDWATLRPEATDPTSRRDVRAELARALSEGPGIVVLAGAFDAQPLDRATAAFERMVVDQRSKGIAAGDHFAKPGANDRIWNALEKLAVADPGAFVDYYANDAVALAAQAWLGRATRSPHSSTSSTPAAPGRRCTATTTSASSPPRRAPATRRTCTRSRRR